MQKWFPGRTLIYPWRYADSARDHAKGKWVFATQNGYLLRSKQLSTGEMYTTHYEGERDRERVKLLKNSSVAELF